MKHKTKSKKATMSQARALFKKRIKKVSQLVKKGLTKKQAWKRVMSMRLK